MKIYQFYCFCRNHQLIRRYKFYSIYNDFHLDFMLQVSQSMQINLKIVIRSVLLENISVYRFFSNIIHHLIASCNPCLKCSCCRRLFSIMGNAKWIKSCSTICLMMTLSAEFSSLPLAGVQMIGPML
jgi:hypothetical protein